MLGVEVEREEWALDADKRLLEEIESQVGCLNADRRGSGSRVSPSRWSQCGAAWLSGSGVCTLMKRNLGLMRRQTRCLERASCSHGPSRLRPIVKRKKRSSSQRASLLKIDHEAVRHTATLPGTSKLSRPSRQSSSAAISVLSCAVAAFGATILCQDGRTWKER